MLITEIGEAIEGKALAGVALCDALMFKITGWEEK